MALTVKRSWVRCEVGLEKAGGKYDYLTATFRFYEASGAEAHVINLGPTNKAPVNEILDTIKARGFKLTKSGGIREWDTATYERARKTLVAEEWVRCDLVLEKAASSKYAYDSVKTICYDADGNRVHADTQYKVKEAPIKKFINALTEANFKVTNIDTVMYTKTYRYERQS